MKKINFAPSWSLALVLAFYFAGAFLIPKQDIQSLKDAGIANQEEYAYTDSEGEEHEGETLIEFKGVGRVLTYSDIYLASIPMLFFSVIFAKFIFDDSKEMECMIFGNCVLGLLLIWLTSKDTIVSTILFWLGIFAAGYANQKPNEN